MDEGAPAAAGFSDVVTAISRLRARRRLMPALAWAGLAAIFIADLAMPGYAISAFYLIVVVFAAAALPRRSALAVAVVAVALTAGVMTAQDRLNEQNALLLIVGIIAGATVFWVSSLYDSAAEAEARLLDALHISSDGLYRFDLDSGKLDYASPSLATLTSIPLTELLTMDERTLQRYVHPDDLATVAAAGEALRRDGHAEADFRVRAGDSHRWLHSIGQVVTDHAGRPHYHIGNVRDITARKRRELGRDFQEDLRDELTRVATADEVTALVGERLGEFLECRYVFFLEREGPGDDVALNVVWDAGRTPQGPLRGALPGYVTDDVVRDLDAGKTVVCADAEQDPCAKVGRFGREDVSSWMLAPFRRDGGWRFAVGVAEDAPRAWREDEAHVLGELAARTFPRIERARAEAALRDSEERFRTIVTHASEGISMLDDEGRIAFINDAFVRLLGYTADEAIGRLPFDFTAPEDHPAIAERLRHEGVGERYDLRIRRKDGEWRWLLMDAAPIARDGEHSGAVALFTDITERKEWESAMALQAHLLANVHDAICALDGEYRVNYWNEAAEQLFGWTREEALGRESRELLRADVPESSRDEALDTLLREGWYAGEVQYRHKDGHAVWADVRSRLIRGEDGATEGVVASFRDIAEQRRARAALTWEAARLRAIVEAAPVGLSVIAADGEVVLRNDVLRRLWEGEVEMHGMADFGRYRASWPETGEPVTPEEWPAARALAEGKASSDVVIDIERFDGSHGTIVVSAAPIVDDGEILGAVSIAQDITHVREAERALRFLTEEVRTLHEAVVLDASVSGAQLAYDVVAQAGLLLGSDASSIFLLDEDGALERIAGVGADDPPAIDDLVAQAIGERAAQIKPLPPPAWETRRAPGSVLLAVPLVARGHVFGAMAFTYLDRRSLDDTQRGIAIAFADQAALAIENARLRARIEETAIETERNRLARDLHDSVTQSLFAASLKAEALTEMLGDGQTPAAEAAQELRRLSRGALAGMRTMLIEMRAGGLTETPLPELLRHLVEASGSRFGADVQLSTRGRAPLPAEVQTALYRIAQEALNNVARHAQASRAWVDLRLGEHDVRLQIGDDGRGFERSRDGAGHFGLENMRERASGIGATLTVDSGAGRGTVVTVEWSRGRQEAHRDG